MTTNHLQGHCIARLVWRAFSLELHLPSKIYWHRWRSVTFPTYFYYQSHFLWKGFGRIVGISKRCCPTCQQLLLLLGTGKAPFVIRGSHSTVTACTLPTWLPAHVVDSMNNIFGDRLRWELLNLIESSECCGNTLSPQVHRDFLPTALNSLAMTIWYWCPKTFFEGLVLDGNDIIIVHLYLLFSSHLSSFFLGLQSLSLHALP